jgi:hypothetical protein
MLTCTHCGVEKANVHMYRLGETAEPICKQCQSYQLPDAEFEAMRVCSSTIEKLQPEAHANHHSVVYRRRTGAVFGVSVRHCEGKPRPRRPP